MNLNNIIVLVVLLVLTVFLITFLIVFLKRQKKLHLRSLSYDLSVITKNYKGSTIKPKDLPVSLEEINHEEAYFCNKVVNGRYENPKKVTNSSSCDLTHLLKNEKLKLFYSHTLIFNKQKFTPLHKIDLLVTKNNVHLYHPLEPQNIPIANIKSITIFWEKNPLIKRKEYFPAVSFNCKNKNYFLLFQTYNEALHFIVCVNTLQKGDSLFT